MKSEKGFTLIEVIISMAILTIVIMGCFKLMTRMERSNKKANIEISLREEENKLRKIIYSLSSGKEMSDVDTELFFHREEGGKLMRRKSTIKKNKLDDLHVQIDKINSFQIIKRIGKDKIITYRALCLPYGVKAETLSYTDIIETYNKVPIFRKVNGSRKIYCCERSNLNCLENDILESTTPTYSSRIVRLTNFVSSKNTKVDLLSRFEGEEGVSGLGFFIEESGDNLKVSYFIYQSECHYRHFIGRRLDSCSEKIKMNNGSDIFEFNQKIGIGSNDLGSDLGF